MPALFALTFSPALRDLHADLRSDEQALAGLPRRRILGRRCPLQRLGTIPRMLHVGGNTQLHAQVMSSATEPSDVS